VAGSEDAVAPAGPASVAAAHAVAVRLAADAAAAGYEVGRLLERAAG